MIRGAARVATGRANRSKGKLSAGPGMHGRAGQARALHRFLITLCEVYIKLCQSVISLREVFIKLCQFVISLCGFIIVLCQFVISLCGFIIMLCQFVIS